MEGKTSRFKVLIIGGGTGGITVAARLRRFLQKDEIGIIEPSEFHYYQPFWTLVGGGVVSKEDSQRKTKDYIPEGVLWFQSKVTSFQPKENQVTLSTRQVIGYDYLVVATGLKVQFDKIEGLEATLGQNGVCTIYDYKQSETTFEMINSFKGGRAIFTMPPVPIKCAGAPQKIMYLADEIFRDHGIRESTKVSFYTNGPAMFGIPVFAQALAKVAERKGIDTHFLHRLCAIKADRKVAVFEKVPMPGAESSGPLEKVEVSFDLLHVAPPNGPLEVVSNSDLAWKEGPHKGWLKVDQFTLQNPDFPNVFGLGDIAGMPNAKTGAAIRKQAPILVDNLRLVMESQVPSHKYKGYSSCPLVTSRHSVILAEFGYDSQLLPSFPLDPAKERYSMWLLKRYALPLMYWNGMLRGRA